MLDSLGIGTGAMARNAGVMSQAPAPEEEHVAAAKAWSQANSRRMAAQGALAIATTQAEEALREEQIAWERLVNAAGRGPAEMVVGYTGSPPVMPPGGVRFGK